MYSGFFYGDYCNDGTKFVNGKIADSIAISDRGLAYGDGCFTTALITAGKVVMLAQHLQRLVQQSRQLGLPSFDVDTLATDMLMASEGITQGIVKVIITSGSGGRGYSRIGVAQASVIISVHDYPSMYPQWQEEGICVGVSELKLGINPMLAGIKHLNRLEQVLLRAELDQRSEDDLLVSDINGHVIECCSANVFWLTTGQWQTPQLTTAGVAGLMRAHILQNNPNIEQGDYSLTSLANIDAMFISNAILGIVPVKIFNGKKLDTSLVENIKR